MSIEYPPLPNRNYEYEIYATYLCEEGHTTVVMRTATKEFYGLIPERDWCTKGRCTAPARLIKQETVQKR